MKLVDEDSPNTQMRKGIIEFCILRSISKERLCGVDLLALLNEKEFELTKGTLYPLLSRLRTKGLVTPTVKPSPLGPPRKYYDLTTKGKRLLLKRTTELDVLIKALNRFIS